MPGRHTFSDLVLSTVFAELNPIDLQSIVRGVPNMAWRERAILEIFRKNSFESWFFINRYMDYLLKHPSNKTREFLSLTGMLNNWHQLPAWQSSLLFGVFVNEQPERALAILLRATQTFHPSDELPLATINLYISLYSFARSDKIRNILFKKLKMDIRQGNQQSAEIFILLSDFLSPKHLREFANLANGKNILATMLEESPSICDLETLPELPRKLNWSPWMRQDINLLGAPSKFENANYIIHRMSEQQKLQLLLDFITTDMEDVLGLQKIIPYFATINLREKLSKLEFRALMKFLKSKNYKGNDGDHITNLLILFLHPQLPYLPDEARMHCLIHFFMKFSPERYQEMPDNFSNLFYELFVSLPEGLESEFEGTADEVAERDILPSQHYAMAAFCLLSFNKVEYHESLLFDPNCIYDIKSRPFHKIPNHIKQFAFKILIKLLRLSEIPELQEYVPLFMLSRLANGLTQTQGEEIFSALLCKLKCSIENLHETIPSKQYLNILILLYELKPEITTIHELKVTTLIEQFTLKAQQKDDISKFLQFYQPKLTSDQTTKILEHFSSHPNRFEHLDQHVIAGFGKNLKAVHAPLLTKLYQDCSTEPLDFLIEAAAHDRPAFSSKESLINGIESCKGFQFKNSHGIFAGQPNRLFREMLAHVRAMDSGEISMDYGYQQLQRNAQQLNEHDLLKVIAERIKFDHDLQETFTQKSIVLRK